METRRIVLSSGRMNRKGYRIPVEVINISDYLANPVLLAEHEYDNNIGHMEDIRIENGKLTALPVFASTELGQRYKTLYEERGINAISMGGFVKLNADRNEALAFDLWENSMTSVPADPGAVAMEAGVALSTDEAPEKLSGISPDVMEAKLSAGYEYVTLNCWEEEEEANLSAGSGVNKSNEMEENKNLAPETGAPAEGATLSAPAASAPAEEPKTQPEPAALAAPEPKQVSEPAPATLGLNPAMPQMDMPKVRVSTQRASLSALMKEKGMDGISEMLEQGNENEKLHVFDAIKNTPAGKVFFDKLHFNIDNGARPVRVSVAEYMNNRESLSSSLREIQKLSMSGNAKLNASTDFVESPALDRIAFSAMAYLKLFPTNLWVNRMRVLPAQMVGDNVGIVWANIGFDNNITTQPAQTNTTVTPATIVAKADKPVSMQIYEHLLEPMLWKRYNQDIVAYDQMGLQWDVALNNLFTAMYDWDLFTLAQKIATAKSGYTPKVQGTSGEALKLGGNWVKVPSNTGDYNGLTMKDIQELEAFFQTQNVRVESLNPVINVDPSLQYSLTQDPKVQTVLTRFVEGYKNEDLRVSYSRVFTRQYLGVYDPTTSAVINPVTGTPTATMVQYGLGLIPEYVLRGLASMEVFTKIEPTLYGEVYSAEIKTGIAPAYENNLGPALIVPTKYTAPSPGE